MIVFINIIRSCNVAHARACATFNVWKKRGTKEKNNADNRTIGEKCREIRR